MNTELIEFKDTQDNVACAIISIRVPEDDFDRLLIANSKLNTFIAQYSGDRDCHIYERYFNDRISNIIVFDLEKIPAKIIEL